MAIAELLIQAGKLEGQRFAVARSETLTVGRGKACVVRVRDKGVSRVHCKLESTATTVTVADAGSSNGTWVNGERIETRELKNGDLVTVGTCVFRFLLLEDEETLAFELAHDESTKREAKPEKDTVFGSDLAVKTHLSPVAAFNDDVAGDEIPAAFPPPGATGELFPPPGYDDDPPAPEQGELDLPNAFEIGRDESTILVGAEKKKPLPILPSFGGNQEIKTVLHDDQAPAKAEVADVASEALRAAGTALVLPAGFLDSGVKSGRTVLLSEDTDLQTALRKKYDNLDNNPLRGAEIAESAQASKLLSAMYDLGQVIYSERSLPAIGAAVTSTILELSGGERAAVLLSGGDDQELQPVAMRDDGDRDEDEFQVSRTIIDETLRQGISVISSDAAEDSRFKAGKSVLMQAVHSVLCVPLQAHDEVVGVVYVDSTAIDVVFGEVELAMVAAIGQQAGVAFERARLISDLEKLFIGSILAITASIEAKDAYTRGHSERVTIVALMIADQLGVSADDRNVIELGALMHDVGKIGMPETVLQKPGSLTDLEFHEVKRHPVVGAKIIGEMPELGRIVDMEAIVSAVKHHHEMFDGSGYPDGLAAEAIPFAARVLAVADTFDALTSDRPYRKGCEIQAALEIIVERAGVQFDAEVVGAFEAILNKPEDELASLNVPRRFGGPPTA